MPSVARCQASGTAASTLGGPGVGWLTVIGKARSLVEWLVWPGQSMDGALTARMAHCHVKQTKRLHDIYLFSASSLVATRQDRTEDSCDDCQYLVEQFPGFAQVGQVHVPV